jgi:hypothetical protein
MNGPDIQPKAGVFRGHQQNTAGESNPAHFSVNGIRGDVSLDDSDNDFGPAFIGKYWLRQGRCPLSVQNDT